MKEVLFALLTIVLISIMVTCIYKIIKTIKAQKTPNLWEFFLYIIGITGTCSVFVLILCILYL